VIPEFDDNNNLPPGIHDATMAEVQARFAHNEKRKQLFAGLEEVISILKDCNCPEVFLDGSFITQKEQPNELVPPFYVNHVNDWQKDGRNDDVAKGILRIDLRQD